MATTLLMLTIYGFGPHWSGKLFIVALSWQPQVNILADPEVIYSYDCDKGACY